MNKNILNELVLIKKELIRRRYDKKEYKDIREFLDNNKLNDIIDFLDVDIWEFIKCKLLSKVNNRSYEECIEIIEKTKEYFENTKEQNIKNLLLLLTIEDKENNLDELIGYFEDNNKLTELKTDLISMTSISLLKKNAKNNNFDLVPLIKCFKDNKPITIGLINIYILYKQMNEFREHAIIISDENIKKSEIERKKKLYLKNVLDYKFETGFILKSIELLKQYREEINRCERLSKREIKNLDTSLEQLEKALEKREILNYKDIIKGIKDTKIKEIVLRKIYNHNKNYHNELNNELDSLKNNSIIRYQSLLNEIGISKEMYDINTIKHNSIEDLEVIISLIKKLEITQYDKLNIIKNTNIDKINEINNYISRGILTSKFISNNIDILYNNNKLDIFKESLKVIEKYNIDNKLFFDRLDIMFYNNKTLDCNLKILEEYNLLKNIKEIDNYIVCNNLRKKIDKLLELGYEKILEENIYILNYDTIDRLELLKLLNYEIDNIDELRLVLDKDRRFVVKDDEISSYIPNVIDNMDKESIDISIEELEQYRENERLYNIDGILISSNKVKYYNKLGFDIISSLTNNLNLDIDNYNKLMKILKNKKLIKE